MGTNYYIKTNVCKQCQRFDSLHIGKSSFGWCFSLHIIPEQNIMDLDDWKKLWNKPETVIEDEYSKSVSPEEMEDIITNREYKNNRDLDLRWLNQNHAVAGPNGLVRHEIGTFCSGYGKGTWDLVIGEFS